ncbi:patatin-like phospholipase family protein [Nocardioides sp.]|uniref:patatin-like phospholipase family protein n=1 Tax=Nocardioides sp. TaxID=35761 RepID=UPI0037852B8E
MTRRALVLAGGGIRVAWQTGVVAALEEDGLTFDHGDGTSGGIFTLGMLLSGQRPDEMVRRWIDLDVRRFVSPLPLRSYLRSPTDWTAFGGAGGVRDAVLPALGIDLARVRAAGPMTGTFNVCDFGRKRCVPIPHTEIDEDRLVAGVSLAGVMPAVEHDGRTWTDAVWIQDANLLESVRRGCDELWVLWCIGNTPRWGTGALEQYVHMIEMSATGALSAELDAIADLNRRRAGGEAVLGSTDPVTVHVIRPDLPIPLDPDLVVGRIDAETLIAMGYRDARRYLCSRSPAGTPLTEDATRTPARELGARITLRATGSTDLGPLAYTLVVEADDLAALRRTPGAEMRAVGTLRYPEQGLRLLGRGTARLAGDGAGRRLEVRADVRLADGVGELAVDVPLPRGRPHAARHHTWRIAEPHGAGRSGTATMTTGQAVRALASFEPSGAHHLTDRARALGLAVALVRRARWSAPVREPA